MSRLRHDARAFLVGSLVVFCLVGLTVATVHARQPSAQRAPVSASSLPDPLTISSSPLSVVVGADSSIQVYHDDWPDMGQVYGWEDGSGDSGVWLWVDGGIYGPDFCLVDRLSTAINIVRPWTVVAHEGPTGSGTAEDPWVVTTVLDAGESGVQVTQSVFYVDGQDHVGLEWDVANLSAAAKTVDLFHANDSYFANDEYGFGYYDAASGAVGGWNDTNPWYILFVPSASGSAYQEGSFTDIWAAIGYCGDNASCPASGACELGPGFDNALDTTPGGTDNAFGLQWASTIEAGGSITLGDWWTFGTEPNIPGQVAPTPTSTPTATATPTSMPSPTPTGLSSRAVYLPVLLKKH